MPEAGETKRECVNCQFCGRLIRSNTAAESIEKIKCRRYPIETEHRPYDWCGEFKLKETDNDCNQENK